MERQKDRLLWIGGHYQRGTDGEFFDNLNPATGDVICRVAVAGAKDVDHPLSPHLSEGTAPPPALR